MAWLSRLVVPLRRRGIQFAAAVVIERAGRLLFSATYLASSFGSARNRSHSFGTPFYAWAVLAPRIPDRSRPLDHAPSERRALRPGRRRGNARADCTAIPARSLPTSSHSPVCRPQRTSSPSERTVSRIALAQRIARAGPSKVASKPSPDVLISRPRYLPQNLASLRIKCLKQFTPGIVAKRCPARRTHDIDKQHRCEHPFRLVHMVRAGQEYLDLIQQRISIARE